MLRIPRAGTFFREKRRRWERKMVYELGDIVKLKKPHPCGGNLWEVVRTGADVKIKCLKCGRVVMLDLLTFGKSLKKVVRDDG